MSNSIEKWQEDANIRGMSQETIKKYSWDILQFATFSASCGVDILAADRALIRSWIDQFSTGALVQKGHFGAPAAALI